VHVLKSKNKFEGCMTNKKVILCDMDGVLVDMLPYWLERYNLKTQENVSVNDVCQWDISKSLEWPDIAYLILEEWKL